MPSCAHRRVLGRARARRACICGSTSGARRAQAVSRSRAVSAACTSTVAPAAPRRTVAPRDHGPSWSITSECPSNTSSSWPPTRLQNATARGCRARAGEHPLALEALACVVGRGGGVDDQGRAGLGSSEAGRPGTHMSSHTVSPIARRRARSPLRRAGLEIALLVGHAVVGQARLAVGRPHVAVGDTATALNTSSARSGNPTIATMPSTPAGQLGRARGASRRKCSLSSRSSGG